MNETIDDRPVMKELRELRDAVQKLSARIAKREDPLFAEGRRYLRRELEKIASGTAPILVGPWTGEVGYELLYWIPFVRWACAEFAIDRRRLIVISRGGVASWYGVPPEQYAEVFDIISPEEFRADATAERSSQKQRERNTLDGRIVEVVARRHGCDDGKVLYPGLMFRAFKQFWDDEAGYERVREFTKYALLERPAAGSPPGLPEDYIAVRFYFRRSFPDKPPNRAFAEAVVRRLAQTAPVVVLTSGLRVDDHGEWTMASDDRITILDSGAPDRNLEVQGAIISGARTFVGTYGGLAYLAPLYGIPSVAFHARPAFEMNHLYVAHRAFAEIGAAPLTTVNILQADLMADALWTPASDRALESS